MGLRELPPELAKLAKDELKEDPKRIEQDLNAMKEWLAKQSHLNARTDDQWLIGFIRGCKYSMERAKEKFDLYYTLRTASPEICLPVDPLESFVQEYLKLGVIALLPKIPDSGEPRVLLVRPGRINLEKIKITDSMRVLNTLIVLLLLEDDNITVAGQRIIVDLDGVTVAHFSQMTPALVKKFVVMLQDAFPFRLKGIHYLNTPSIFETFFGLVKQFMNEKNRNRLLIHNKDMDALYKHVSKSILPTEYGGDAGPIQNMFDDLKKTLENNRELFLEDRQLKSDESKRVGKPKTVETLFGIEGSFRKLTVD